MTTGETLVSAADIARLTGLGRAAVSNWRRRHEDFPRPVGGTANSPLFALPEVEAWLERQGKPLRISEEERLWQLIRTTTDDLRLGEVIGALGAAVYDPDKPLEPHHASRVDEPLVRMALELKDRRGLGTYDYLVQRFIQAHARRVATTPAVTALLMTTLVPVRGRRVLDPACGLGTLLVAARDGGARLLAGQDRERYGIDITWTRLRIRPGAGERANGRQDRDADIAVATGDSLTEDGFRDERFDVALCDPPFGDRAWGYDELPGDPRWVHGLPPRGEPELAWLQHLLWHLTDGGEAAILMPAVAADRRSGRRIRGQLLRNGTLRAVIALPPGSAAGSSAAPHLWLLRRPAPGDRLPSHLLVMDASNLPNEELVRSVTGTWERHRRRAGDDLLDEDEDEPTGPARAVPLIELLDDAVDLTPAHHLHRAPAARADFDAARERLQDRLAAAATAVERLPMLTEATGEQSRTTVGELVQGGAVVLLQAPPKMELESGDLPVLTAEDVVLGRPPSARTADADTTLRLRPGDVVVVPRVSRQIVVRVIDEEGIAAGPQLQVVRPDAQRCDPYFLACFLRASGAGGVARAISTSSRGDLRRTVLPRLPIAEQRSYGLACRRLLELGQELRTLADTGDDVIDLGLGGLGGGGLRPES